MNDTEPKPSSDNQPGSEIERPKGIMKGLGEDWFSSALEGIREQVKIVGQRIEYYDKKRGEQDGSGKQA